MVEEGQSNEKIYTYVKKNYGENQVAIPRHGWFNRLSYGLPFLLIGLIMVVAMGFAWSWAPDEPPEDDDRDPPETGDDDKRERVEKIAADGGPLG